MAGRARGGRSSSRWQAELELETVLARAKAKLRQNVVVESAGADEREEQLARGELASLAWCLFVRWSRSFNYF